MGIMECNLAFWKQNRAIAKQPADVYEQLCDTPDGPVDGVDTLPTDAIRERLQERFPDLEAYDDFVDLSFEQGDLEISFQPRIIHVEMGGLIPAEAKNAIVDIMAEFDCPLFDVEEEKRYDADEGTALGDKHVFQDPSPEELKQIKQILSMRDGMREVFGGERRGKQGCLARMLIGFLRWLFK